MTDLGGGKEEGEEEGEEEEEDTAKLGIRLNHGLTEE